MLLCGELLRWIDDERSAASREGTTILLLLLCAFVVHYGIISHSFTLLIFQQLLTGEPQLLTQPVVLQVEVGDGLGEFFLEHVKVLFKDRSHEYDRPFTRLNEKLTDFQLRQLGPLRHEVELAVAGDNVFKVIRDNLLLTSITSLLDLYLQVFVRVAPEFHLFHC